MPLSANKEAFLPTGVLLDGCFSLTGNLTLQCMTTPGGQPCLRCWKWSVWSEQPQQAKSCLNHTSCPFKLSVEEQRNPWTVSACFMTMLYLRVTHCLSHLAVCLNWKIPQKMDGYCVFHPNCLQKGTCENPNFTPFKLHYVWKAQYSESHSVSFSRVGKCVYFMLSVAVEWEGVGGCVVVAIQELYKDVNQLCCPQKPEGFHISFF